jgi:hypothetical protein
LGIGQIRTTAFAVVVSLPQGPAGLATTGLPQRGVIGAPAGESELPGTGGRYQVDQQIAVLLDPVSLLAPERVGGPEFHNDLAAIAVG